MKQEGGKFFIEKDFEFEGTACTHYLWPFGCAIWVQDPIPKRHELFETEDDYDGTILSMKSIGLSKMFKKSLIKVSTFIMEEETLQDCIRESVNRGREEYGTCHIHIFEIDGEVDKYGILSCENKWEVPLHLFDVN